MSPDLLIAEATILTLTPTAGNQLSSIGAAVEHAVVVTAGAPLILTA